ncbi:MAG: VRR-NUC domain-containing protein [Myxococcota bacterium]
MRRDSINRATLQAILHAPLSGLDEELHEELGLGRANLSEKTYWGERAFSGGHHAYNSIGDPAPKHVEAWLADVMELTGYSKAYLCGDDAVHALTLGLVRVNMWQQYGLETIEQMSPTELDETRLDQLVGLDRLDDDGRKRELEHNLAWLDEHAHEVRARYRYSLPARRDAAERLINFLTWPELLLVMAWLWEEGPDGFPDLLVTPPLASPFFAEVEAEGESIEPTCRRCMDYLVHTAGIRCRIIRVRDANKNESSYHQEVEERVREARDPRSRFFLTLRDISNRLSLDLPFFDTREDAMTMLEQRLQSRADELREKVPTETQQRLLELSRKVDADLHALLQLTFQRRPELEPSSATQPPGAQMDATITSQQGVVDWLSSHPLITGALLGLIIAILAASGLIIALLITS